MVSLLTQIIDSDFIDLAN